MEVVVRTYNLIANFVQNMLVIEIQPTGELIRGICIHIIEGTIFFLWIAGFFRNYRPKKHLFPFVANQCTTDDRLPRISDSSAHYFHESPSQTYGTGTTLPRMPGATQCPALARQAKKISTTHCLCFRVSFPFAFDQQNNA